MPHTTSDLWLRNLDLSLKASRQVAYLWHVDDDRFEFMGDTGGLLGCAEGEEPGRKDEFAHLVNPQDMVTRQLAIADAIARCKSGLDVSFSVSYKIRRSDGRMSPVMESGVAHFDFAEGRTTVQSLLSHDKAAIDEQMKALRRYGAKDRISYIFSGSNGRQALEHQLEELLQDQRRDKGRGFLLVVGIDRLSLINEAYGSQAADEVIAKTGARLEQMVGGRATIARLSGDVFGVLFPTASHGEMNEIAQTTLQHFFHRPIETQERMIHVVVSIGGIRLDENAPKAASVISRAELALQEAKAQGRGCFVSYTEKMHEQVDTFRDTLSIGDEFLKGFRDGRVRLAYQAVMGAKSGGVSFYECLIRLIDENGVVQPAGKFIGAVEKMGLTRLVDGFCVQQAIRELMDYPGITLSVNVSNHTLTDAQWLRDVTDLLRDRVDVAERLIVEITESSAMSDIAQTIRVIRNLEDLGCKIALDDFGAGQTAFSQIKDLSLDIVKIDKSFVRDMDKEENMLFIKTLQSLADGMNLETVGEGAETIAEAEVLMRGGIDHIQGYAYSLPSIERLWLPERHSQRHGGRKSASAAGIAVNS